MLTYTQAVLMGLLQGVTELFPVSSLGHSVIIPQLLGWRINESGAQFLAFVVGTHVATALVLLVFFWRDWFKIVQGVLRSLVQRAIHEEDTYAKLGWLIVVATIPAGVLGVLFQTTLQQLFGRPELITFVIVINGVLLWFAERLRRRAVESFADDKRLARLSYRTAFGIGLAQAGALIPGLSRTGLAMSGGLLSGLSHEDALRFGFLLSTPIIFAAGVLELPQLFEGAWSISLTGAIAAAIASYLSVKFLTRYFKTRTLTPFAIYCVLAGFLSLIVLAR